MLIKGNKPYLFIFLLIFYFSCKNDSNFIQSDYLNRKFNTYSTDYSIVKDSITNYVDSLLQSFQSAYIWEWQLDSLMCINSTNDRLVGLILSSSGKGINVKGDDAEKILGKKIKNNWYFLKGSTLIIPRDMYGKDAMNPLTFHELSQIARTEFLSGALVKGKNGKYVVDDNWVDEHFYNLGWGRFKDSAKYDSVHWFYITDKWKHKIDTNQYKPLRKNKNSDVVL